MAGTSEPACAACAARPSPFGQGRSAFFYESPFREIIHAFKYEGRRQLARHIADRLLGIPDISQDNMQLVPVPSHAATRRARGYNPAEELAAALARLLGVPCRNLLRKTRRTPPQMTLTARERASNLHDAFAPALGAARRIRHAHLVLVDDVITTGATLRECATILHQAGADRVDFITAARAP